MGFPKREVIFPLSIILGEVKLGDKKLGCGRLTLDLRKVTCFFPETI